ncbi:VWCE protein, partial [Alcedo cyanopectus]|nr:VWCE protein [Ceyx cyanopectus]
RGVPREPGARWTEPGCRSCACQGGQVLCEPTSCPVPCSHPLPPPAGGCCPSCSGCLHEGVARPEGDVFSPSDGNCTVCLCLGSVSLAVLGQHLASRSIQVSPNPSLCGDSTRLLLGAEAGGAGTGLGTGLALAAVPSGDTSPCPQGGDVECSFAPCPALDCPQHQRHLSPGQCCFSCRDPPAPAGEPQNRGGVWGGTAGGGVGCEGCWGWGAWEVGDEDKEGALGSLQPPRPPHSAPPTHPPPGCTYMGRIFYNNETFPSVLDPCLSCICLVR